MNETARRREKQIAYNEKHGITPKTIRKKVADVMEGANIAIKAKKAHLEEAGKTQLFSPKEAEKEIKRLEKEMLQAARDLAFEKAAALRDQIKQLEKMAYIDNA